MSRFSLFNKKRNNDFNSQVNSYHNTSSFSSTNNQRGRVHFPSFKSKQFVAVLVIFVVAILGFAFWFKRAAENIPPAQVLGAQEEVSVPYAQKPIDQTFKFPLRNEKGDKVSEFAYVVQNAELTNEIVVKGQKASAIKGRTFLILNLKINNDGKQKIQVNSRDYVRLMVGNSTELLAPDIHNDPVEVQPISTKYTRLGFAINETDKNVKVQVGEIDGQKQYIDLNFE